MRKLIGLFIVILMSTAAVFAQEDKANDGSKRKPADPAKRWERMAEKLQLDEKQTTEFAKINQEYLEKLKANMEANRADMDAMKKKREEQREAMKAMREEQNEQMKKLLSDEQYKQYQELQKPKRDGRRGQMPPRRGPRGMEKAQQNS